MGWAASCVHVHLIRHPARVIASYGAKRGEMTLEDLGFPQQVAIYRRFGGAVIDSFDIRAAPDRALRAVCAAIGIPFDPAMLHWPPGGRPEDGVWAAHWYGAVHASTGFAGAEGPLPEMSGPDEALLKAAMPHYDVLRTRCLRP